MRFSEYKIVTASTPEKLVAEVNNLIRDRWQPCGGMVVTREVVSGIRETFMQPMVREPNKRAVRRNRTSEHVPQSLKHHNDT